MKKKTAFILSMDEILMEFQTMKNERFLNNLNLDDNSLFLKYIKSKLTFDVDEKENLEDIIFNKDNKYIFILYYTYSKIEIYDNILDIYEEIQNYL